MRILAIEQPADGFPGKPSAGDLRDEATQVWELQQAGSLREIYLTDERSRAVTVLECASAADAYALLETLPLVERGFLAFDLMELEPYSGFARLFAGR
jgi:hypothetical protein